MIYTALRVQEDLCVVCFKNNTTTRPAPAHNCVSVQIAQSLTVHIRNQMNAFNDIVKCVFEPIQIFSIKIFSFEIAIFLELK